MADEENVVLTFLKAHGPYMPKDIAGFPPAVADALIARGIANRDGIVAPTPPPAAPPPKVQAPDFDPGSVTIPDDWEQRMHFLQQIKLAKSIVPGEESMTRERAIEVIRNELARRSAADT